MSADARRTLLDGLALPTGVRGAVSSPILDPTLLWPQERAAITRAVPRRAAEFTGGRVAARRALAALGHPACAIPMAADRAPVWPDGCLGSISHCNDVCAALVARTDTHRMIGLDIEMDRPLEHDVAATVATAAELAEAATVCETHSATRIFSAKEAVYKALYPGFNRVIGFDSLSIRLMSATNGIALPRGALAEWTPRGLPFRQHCAQGFIITACVIPH